MCGLIDSIASEAIDWLNENFPNSPKVGMIHLSSSPSSVRVPVLKKQKQKKQGE